MCDIKPSCTDSAAALVTAKNWIVGLLRSLLLCEKGFYGNGAWTSGVALDTATADKFLECNNN